MDWLNKTDGKIDKKMSVVKKIDEETDEKLDKIDEKMSEIKIGINEKIDNVKMKIDKETHALNYKNE